MDPIQNPQQDCNQQIELNVDKGKQKVQLEYSRHVDQPVEQKRVSSTETNISNRNQEDLSIDNSNQTNQTLNLEEETQLVYLRQQSSSTVDLLPKKLS